MKLAATTFIDRSPAAVFEFCAVDHLRNHPRWDPTVELRPLSDGPIGVGTRFQRRRAQPEPAAAGTVEVTEFNPDRSFGLLTHDDGPTGTVEVRSRITMGPDGTNGTKMTVQLETPDSATLVDQGTLIETVTRIKALIEAEASEGQDR